MTLNEYAQYARGKSLQRANELHNARLIMNAVFQKGNKRRLKPTDIFEIPILDRLGSRKTNKITAEQYIKDVKKLKKLRAKEGK